MNSVYKRCKRSMSIETTQSMRGMDFINTITKEIELCPKPTKLLTFNNKTKQILWYETKNYKIEIPH